MIWDEHVSDYLRLRRQLGFKLAWDEHLLGQFTTHLDRLRIEHLTAETAISWAGLPRQGATERAASRAATRFCAVRSFASYMHAIDPVHEVPPRGGCSRIGRAGRCPTSTRQVRSPTCWTPPPP